MFEEWLYRRLITSPKFHYYVRIVHAMVNNLPSPKPPHGLHEGPKIFEEFIKNNQREAFKPTIRQKFKAYATIWRQEMWNSFTFRK